MSNRLSFRPARPDEADMLAEMTLEGLYHWGYQDDFPQLMEDFRQNNLPTAGYIRQSPVTVMSEDSLPVGYYGLHLQEGEDYVDLRYFFLDKSFIGRGYGKKLWQGAIAGARDLGFEKLRIISDPAAVGFYQAMGATLGGEHAVQPDFVLGIMWYDLTA